MEYVFANSLASSMAFGSYSLYRWYKQRKRTSVDATFCFLTSRRSGTSTQIKRLLNENKTWQKAVILDEDDIINTQTLDKQDLLVSLRNSNTDSYLVQLFPLLKTYLDDIRRIYPKKPVIIFTSQPQLINFLGLKKQNCCVFLPNTEFYKSLMSNMDTDDVSQMTSSREQLLGESYARIMYRSYKDMLRQLDRLIFRTQQ